MVRRTLLQRRCRKTFGSPRGAATSAKRSRAARSRHASLVAAQAASQSAPGAPRRHLSAAHGIVGALVPATDGAADGAGDGFVEGAPDVGVEDGS